MRFAIILLAILAAACAIGSFVTQQQTYEWYAAKYNERIAAFIVAVRLDDAFHAPWFIALSAFLCLNLFLCNLIRVKELIRRTVKGKDPLVALNQTPGVSVENVLDPEKIFEKLHMKPNRVTAEGREVLFASGNLIGIWGAWVCHFGILLLILGFGLGQLNKTEYTVYGVPGQTRQIGDTGLFLSIDDFTVGLRDDDTVEQYTADITVFRAPQGSTTVPDSMSASVSVNHPARMYGMTFYQNSTGWAAVMDISKNGEALQRETICAGEYIRVLDKQDLVICLVAFYPDYVLIPGSGPMTLSGRINNPGYLYAVYYQEQMLGMNVLMGNEPLTIDEYEVRFSEPRSYTLIQIKRDPFTWLALLGGIITTLGLFLAFYLLPKKVWAVREENGNWTVYGSSRKAGMIFAEQFRRAAETGGKGKKDASD